MGRDLHLRGDRFVYASRLDPAEKAGMWIREMEVWTGSTPEARTLQATLAIVLRMNCIQQSKGPPERY